jgi:hypothetical protein
MAAGGITAAAVVIGALWADLRPSDESAACTSCDARHRSLPDRPAGPAAP